MSDLELLSLMATILYSRDDSDTPIREAIKNAISDSMRIVETAKEELNYVPKR